MRFTVAGIGLKAALAHLGLDIFVFSDDGKEWVIARYGQVSACARLPSSSVRFVPLASPTQWHCSQWGSGVDQIMEKGLVAAKLKDENDGMCSTSLSLRRFFKGGLSRMRSLGP